MCISGADPSTNDLHWTLRIRIGAGCPRAAVKIDVFVIFFFL
jgi:hypothetical protein